MTRLAFLLRDLVGGGVERDTLRLARSFLAHGIAVDLLLERIDGPLVDSVPKGVRLVKLESGPVWRVKLLATRADPGGIGYLLPALLLPRRPIGAYPMLPALVDYLRETRPDDLISAFPYQNLLAVAGRRAAGAGTRVVITERSTTTALASRRLKWKRRSLPALVRRSYLMARAVVAVSNGLADLLASQLGLPRDKIATVYSPIVSEELVAAPAEPVDRPWFRVGEPPVAFGFGHLTEQKDFPTFVPVCNDAALATRASRVFLFRHLPSARQSSAAIARAARAKSWKGAGTAGLGDDQAMAQAILAALKNPGDRASRIARGQQFSVDRAVDRYLGLFRSAGLGLTFGRRSARAAPELAAS